VNSIYTKLALESLYSLNLDRNALPSSFVVSKGTIRTSYSVTPSATIPLGNQVHRTIVVGESQLQPSEIVGAVNGIGLQGTVTFDQSWEVMPQKDPVAIQKLRNVYLYVLGLKEGSPFKPNDFSSVERALNSCKGCFQVRKDAHCEQPEAADLNTSGWICLNKYRSIEDRLLRPDEIMISKSAWNDDVFFSVVLYSLQVQAEPERDALRQNKAVEVEGQAVGTAKVKASGGVGGG
jgi:hypothetical protein